jgi:hypothetical protein
VFLTGTQRRTAIHKVNIEQGTSREEVRGTTPRRIAEPQCMYFCICDDKATLCLYFVRAFQVTAGKFDKHIVQAGMPNSQVRQVVVSAEQLRDQLG